MHVVRARPRSVVGADLAGEHQGPVVELCRAHVEQPSITEASDRRLREVLVELAQKVDIDCAHRAEIADIGKVRPLANIGRIDELGDQKIETGISLAVASP